MNLQAHINDLLVAAGLVGHSLVVAYQIVAKNGGLRGLWRDFIGPKTPPSS